MLAGRKTLLRAVHPENAESPMLLTLAGMEYEPGFAKGNRTKFVFSLLSKTPSKLA